MCVRNIIEKRYNLSEGRAAEESSLLLAGSMFLYPLVSNIISECFEYLFNHYDSVGISRTL